MIVNGAGYDPWAPKLIDANPTSGRKVLTVGDLAGRKEGDNPHMWYDPTIVFQVVDQITADYKSLDYSLLRVISTNRTVTSRPPRWPTTTRCVRPSNPTTVAFPWAPLRASSSTWPRTWELNLITPSDYMRAISEGNDPTSADKTTFDTQVTGKQIKVLVFNKQNSTPDIQTLIDKANAEGIPVVAITETLDPASATFQQWQGSQFDALQAALSKATGH